MTSNGRREHCAFEFYMNAEDHSNCTAHHCVHIRTKSYLPKGDTLMSPKDVDDTIPDLPMPDISTPSPSEVRAVSRPLKEVPYLDDRTDFHTIYGAARHWYNEYLMAEDRADKAEDRISLATERALTRERKRVRFYYTFYTLAGIAIGALTTYLSLT